MVGEKKRYLLFGFLMLFLVLPMLQQQLKVIDSGTLNGVALEDTTRPGFSSRNWFGDSFQSGQDNYVQHSIGFRPDFIRVSNQVSYSLFNKTNAAVVIGKNANLFDQSYIDAYYGKDYAGMEQIKERVRKLKFIQDTLDKLGKTLVFIYAPSKVRYMPEDIPDELRQARNAPTNYDAYKRFCTEAGVRQIDLNAWFIEQRPKRKHPLFARAGIHWTTYGGLIAMDSLQRFMKIHSGWDTPDISWNDDQQNATGGPLLSENDLEKIMNLAFPLKREVLFHPSILIDQGNKKAKPRAIYIGDSFTFMWTDQYLPDNINSFFQFWCYYLEVHTYRQPGASYLTDKEKMREILLTDWVVIMYTDRNFARPGNAFIERAYEYFTGVLQ